MTQPKDDPPEDHGAHFEPTRAVGDSEDFATIPTPAETVEVGDTLPYVAEHATSESQTSEEAPLAKDALFARRFELVKVLGEGGMGRVYLAKDSYVENRSVALKVLRVRYSKNEEFRRLFFREIKTAQRFVSEQVNQVRDTGQDEDGTLFLTMDLVEGVDLAKLLSREQTLNVRHALDITRQILAGLHSGHEVGFVHRDVKPSNIMLADRVTKTDENPFGVGVRLLDFGIAGLAAEFESGEIVGTPTYMSPEQIQGERLDARSDLFAVGVVLYEMIAGSRPFGGKTVAAITDSILETDVEPLIRDLSNLSRPLQRLLSKALAKDRDKRFQTALEFIEAIERSKAYKLPRVMPLWAGGLLVTLAVGAGAAGYFLERTHEAKSSLELAFQNQSNELEALRTSKDDEIARLATENQRLRDGRQQKVDEDQGSQDLLNQLETAREANLGLQRDYEQKDEEARTVRAELTALIDKHDTLRNNHDSLQREHDELQTKVALLERERDKHFVVAKRFDDVLMKQWSDRLGHDSQASLANLVNASPVDGRLAGKGYLEEVSDLVAGIEDFRRSASAGGEGDSLRAAAVGAIAAAIGPVRDGLDGFAIAADEWLWHGVEERSQPSAPRVEALEHLLHEGGLLAEARAALESRARAEESEWAEIQAAGDLQGPERVALFAARFDGGEAKYVAPTLERFAAALSGEVAPDGRLALDALRSLDAIAEWSSYLAARPKLERSDAGRTVSRFQHARRWFTEPRYLGEDFDRGLFAGEAALDGSSTDDWAAQLALMHDLIQPESAFPAPAGGRLVYRVTFRENGRTVWRKVQLAGSEDVSGAMSFRLSEEQFSADGTSKLGPEISRTIERRGKVFTEVESGAQLLHLGGAAKIELAEREIRADQAPPSQIVSESEWRKFKRELGDERPVCLGVESHGTQRWISPRYGLVYQENERMTIELVFGSYSR